MLGIDMRSLVKKILLTLFKREGESGIQVDGSSKLVKSKNVTIKNSKITLKNGAELVLGENVVIENYTITIESGKVFIGNFTQILGVHNTTSNSIYVNNGSLTIAHHCIIQSEFCVRFGGICSVDCFTGIMHGTEIRCDEKLSIGKYNMISYDCMIYDTNTHCEYEFAVRRELTKNSFPYIGLEKERPATSPVVIGDDCWLGKRSVVLKGVTIGNCSTIGACAVVTKSAPGNSLLYGNPAVHKTKS
jgi:acetyltransferase-like isoleucine patch superfamily enzyme